MADQHQYAKKRKEFGRHPQFDDTVTKIVGSVMPNHTQKDLYQQRDPNKLILDNIPQFSEHRVGPPTQLTPCIGEHRENPHAQPRNEARCRR